MLYVPCDLRERERERASERVREKSACKWGCQTDERVKSGLHVSAMLFMK